MAVVSSELYSIRGLREVSRVILHYEAVESYLG